jgi:O-antigen ligase
MVALISPSGEALISQQQAVEPGTTEPAAVRADRSTGLAHSLSINSQATSHGLVFVMVFALFFVGSTRGLDKSEIDRVVRGIFAVGVVLALAGIAQRAGSNTKLYGLWLPYYNLAQPFGPFVNRNHFAGWMLMALPVCIGYFFGQVSQSLAGTSAAWKDRVLWLSSTQANKVLLLVLGILVMALSLVMTLSRSGVICLAVALLIVGVVVARRAAGGFRRSVAVLVLCCTVVLTFGWGGMDAVLGRFAEPNMLTLNGRLFIWRDTARIIRDAPLVGTGLGTYATAMASYQTPVPGWNFSVAQAHSDYLQLAAEGGLLLTAGTAVLLVTFIREARRRFRQCASSSSAEYWIRVGAVTGLVAIALQETAEFSLQIPGNAALFTVLLALVAGGARTLDHERVAARVA